MRSFTKAAAQSRVANHSNSTVGGRHIRHEVDHADPSLSEDNIIDSTSVMPEKNRKQQSTSMHIIRFCLWQRPIIWIEFVYMHSWEWPTENIL